MLKPTSYRIGSADYSVEVVQSLYSQGLLVQIPTSWPANFWQNGLPRLMQDLEGNDVIAVVSGEPDVPQVFYPDSGADKDRQALVLQIAQQARDDYRAESYHSVDSYRFNF